MKKFASLTFILLFTSLSSMAQEFIFRGLVTNKDNTPLDVVSIVIFNKKDTTEQVYANTFKKGKFEFYLPEKGGKEYSACLLSIGYEDTYIPLEKLSGNIVMRNKLLRVDDAVVKGKNDVKSEISNRGGVVYNVNKTYLSEMGTSTKLLNFIPGLSADNNGNISVIGKNDAVVYVNDVLIDDNQKILSIKSEDIKSVEVIRSPGARYKNANAVVLIKTSNTYIGFSSRVTGMYYHSTENEYSYSPRLELAYNKNKINVSGAYNFNQGTTKSTRYMNQNIDNSIIADNWKFNNDILSENDDLSHWYNANIDYNINEKNFLNFQYTGMYNPSITNSSNIQTVISDRGTMYTNDLTSVTDAGSIRNAAHLFYQGKYTNTFGMTVNADFSQRNNTSDRYNEWIENGVPFQFRQNTKTDAMAFTTEILFNNVIKYQHQINYGAEYSYLTDDVRSNDMLGNATKYSLNSHFIKAILEFKTVLFKKVALSVGGNYMYSTTENNSGQNIDYNSIIPYLSLQYYNQQKQLGVMFDLKYYNRQPDAGLLDDVTVTYTSPYNISTGNKDLKNEKNISSSLSFVYKKLVVGAQAYIAYQWINTLQHVEIQADGSPLFINRPENFNKPVWVTGIYGMYSNNIKFWNFNVTAMLTYGYANTPVFNGKSETVKGVQGVIMMTNNFQLPNNFSIYLRGEYRSRQPQAFVYQNASYGVDLNIEKRFFNNNLRVALEMKMSNRYITYDYNLLGIDSYQKISNDWNNSLGLVVSWRFNNHKSIQTAKENEYLNMLK